MNKDDEYTAFEATRPHFDALARAGYFKLIPKSESSLKNTLHYCYRIVVWGIVFSYNLQHFMRLIQARHSTEQIVNTLFILLTTLNTLGKQLTFNLRRCRVDRLISVLKGPIFASQNPHHEKLLRANAVVMLQVLRFYIFCIFVCGIMWTIFPLVNRALGEKVEFTAYFPFDTDQPIVFELVVAYMNIFIILQAYGNVTMDCTIVAFYAQVKVQLEMLRYNLEHLTDVYDNKAEENEFPRDSLVNYKDVVDKRFKMCLQKKFEQCLARHKQLKWFIAEIEDAFAECLFFQMLVAAWVICMTVYKMVGLHLLSAEFLSMSMYLVCMLAQLFVYCYYGTKIKYESQFVNQSLYCGDWTSLSPSFRRQLLIMMENCKTPITPRTAYIIPITLETYIAILRASYTLFTFLDRK